MVLLFAVGGCKKEEAVVPVPAKPPKKAVAPIQTSSAEERGGEYHYDPIGKRDPFKPFIQLEKKETTAKRAVAPLQIFDLTELRLVGIILLPGKKVAMVEDPSGKGYNIREGTLIGKNEGRVIDIMKDEVVVEERFVDEMAQTKTRKVSMKIQREQGGEDR